jgi:hypothetical protein
VPNFPVAAQNLTRTALNHLARLGRRSGQRSRRTMKQVRESLKEARANVRAAAAATRDASSTTRSGAIRMTRYWRRVHGRTLPRVAGDVRARVELWRVARGNGPIIVGPWLSEVGYEVLYWVPFLRWFVDYYRVDPARVVAVSRGGVSAWYGDIAREYVELLELYPPEEFAAKNRARLSNDQKQLGISEFDREILDKVRARVGGNAATCHPSVMFRLLRQFWLGNESLDYALSYLSYRPVGTGSSVPVPPLPPDFVAMKFYSARSLAADARHRELLRGLIRRIAQRHPVVLLSTGLALDEHEDFLFADLPGVTNVAGSMRPENNLGVQTEIIRRARRFVGTCGSVAWLAPMLGTDTLAVYSDDHLLTSHLYAARHGYASMSAGRFAPLDLNALEQSDVNLSELPC